MYSILVAGAGYTGLAIAAAFAQKKQKVWGLVRSSAGEAKLKEAGVRPFLADMTDPASLKDLPAAHFVVISAAPDTRDEAGYRRIYVEAVGHLLERVKKNPKPFLVVYLSSTGVYGTGQEGRIDENVEPVPDTGARILLEAEKQVLGCGLPAVVFRLAGIYGPERNMIARVREELAGEDPALPSVTDRWVNLIHRDDIAGAMPVLFNKAEPGSVILGVDDEPVKRRELCRWIGDRLGMEEAGGPAAAALCPGRQYANGRLKALGVKLLYPTFRDGYEPILKSMESTNA
jgi:nucleoside-diphosphate-sugar epimerase